MKNKIIENTMNSYPIEQSFKLPLVMTILLVLIPALTLYFSFGASSDTPRALKLFFGNWISPIILWFFMASFFHLLLKRKKLIKEQKQADILAKQVFPASLTNHLDGDIDGSLHDGLQTASKQQGIPNNNLLLTRINLFLNHHEDDIDDNFGIKEREQMKGSFSLPRFMVWAIPILGFIGTVWGISNGIAHFSDAMTSTQSVTDISSMLKDNLPLVTNSLATAFDTTLLALLLSIPLMMLMLALEKEEEAYLINLDEMWYHDIKPLLQTQSDRVNTVITTGSEVETGVSSSSDNSTQVVANEIKQLSTQVKALQETMEDLYETIFTSKLTDKS
ncbi:MAG: MotA/TolQ/ExbB proton channel family protein [Thiotrichaceae bacterium]|nr:MotA/TolQ/ExbB proton channel family protein [Thiotrichaceae bacterium]